MVPVTFGKVQNTQAVFDEDNLAQDKRLGVIKLPLIDLEPEVSKEYDLRLMPSLDMMKIKDKKDRGMVTVKMLYHVLNKEEQEAAFEEEKKSIEQRRQMKESGMIGSTVDAVGGAASLVGSGVGLVGSVVGAGVGLVGSGVGAGVGLVGTGVGAGVGLVGSGIGTGAGIVGSGLGAVGSGISKAGKFMGKSVTNQFSSARRNPNTFDGLGNGADWKGVAPNS